MKINNEFIRGKRIEKGLSVRSLSKLAGISISQVSDIENGQLKNTTVDTICKLATALGCNPTDLFTC